MAKIQENLARSSELSQQIGQNIIRFDGNLTRSCKIYRSLLKIPVGLVFLGYGGGKLKLDPPEPYYEGFDLLLIIRALDWGQSGSRFS